MHDARKRKLIEEAEARGHKLTEFKYIRIDGFEAAYCEICRRSVTINESLASGNCLKFDCFDRPIVHTPARAFYAGLLFLMEAHGIEKDMCYRVSECCENKIITPSPMHVCECPSAMPFKRLEQEFRVSVLTLDDLRGLLTAVGGYDHDSWYAFETLRLYAEDKGIDLNNMPVREETPSIAA
jgi:hypothetical protein